MFRLVLLAAAGSALGGVARVGLSGAIYKRYGWAFPWGTLAVNLAGCFLIGLFNAWAEERLRLGPAGRALLMAGFCGAFTTFSTFALETAHLLKGGRVGLAALYIGGSAAFGLLLFALGERTGRLI